MAAAGGDPHGEVAFVERSLQRLAVPVQDPPRVLDAGCGTGRVAIELARRGFEVMGVDVDPVMLDAAQKKSPQLRWEVGDLSRLAIDNSFDAVVMAGNVILFVEPADRPLVLPTIARHLRTGGLLIAGFQLAGLDEQRRVPLPLWDGWAAGAGLELVERFSAWDDEEWSPASDYVVTVHRVGAG